MSAILRRLTAISLILVLTLIAAAPGQVLAGGNISPRAMLIQYYTAINARQYAVAYQQWINPPQTYADFAAGYANTASATAYFGGFQPGAPGSIDGRVPGILVGVDYTGSPSVFYGCYNVHYNDTATGVGQWSITGANFTQVANAVASGSSYILPRTDCYNLNAAQVGGIGDLPPAVSAEQLLVRYFSDVNVGAYDLAYAFWASPRQTYDQFVAGWATTTDTVLFYGTYQPWRGTYATYETGRVPVVLMGYHTDGSLVAYQGCLGVNYSATRTAQPWGLWQSYVRAMTFTTTPSAAAITQALAASCY
jgi:hypothetical protein